MATNWEALRAGLRRETARLELAFVGGGMPQNVARAAAVACNVARISARLGDARTDRMRENAAAALVVARDLVAETPDAAGLLWRLQGATSVSVSAAGGPFHPTGEALVFLSAVAAIATAVVVAHTAAAFEALADAQRVICADWPKHRDTLAAIQARGLFAPSKVAA